MKHTTAAFLGVALSAVVATSAIALNAANDPADTGGLLPTVEQGIPEPDLSDTDLFVDGETVTDGDTVSVSSTETGGLIPLAPESGTEPAPSDVDLFIEDEPVTDAGDVTMIEKAPPETGGLTPLAPEGGVEPAPSDLVLFIEGEPVT